MKTKLIELLKDFQDATLRARFSENGSLLKTYDEYADNILDLIEENRAQKLKEVDGYYNSDFMLHNDNKQLELFSLSIQDEIS